MKMKQLYTFRIVCEEESITKAAARLSTTQPAISRTISELEDSLGIRLFDRSSRKVVLNETGQLFLSKVIPLLELYEDLEQTFQDASLSSTLRIGVTPIIVDTILPGILNRFSASHEDDVKVTINDEHELETQLLNRSLDLVLMEGLLDHDSLVKVPVSTEPLAVLASPSHPLAAMPVVTVPEMVEYPLLLKEPGSLIRQLIDSAFLFYSVTASPIWTSSSSHALLTGAEKGFGITILPRILAEDSLRLGRLMELPVEAFNLSCTSHVMFLQDKYQTFAFQSLVNIILFNE
ncbi:LysR family transcriptional regulator [Lachnospiraceae bacterium 62-35]